MPKPRRSFNSSTNGNGWDASLDDNLAAKIRIHLTQAIRDPRISIVKYSWACITVQSGNLKPRRAWLPTNVSHDGIEPAIGLDAKLCVLAIYAGGHPNSDDGQR